MKRKYENPPVVEALCEFYFTGSEWDSTIPGIFYNRIKNEFPNISPQKQIKLDIQISGNGAPNSQTKEEHRARFMTTNNTRMVQISRDLLVINQLRPYPEKFDDWKSTVSAMLKTYIEIAKPKNIHKIGVRFINHIVIPTAHVKMESYFRIYPEVPTDLAPHHEEFLLRLNMPPKIPNHNLIITFSTAPVQQSGQHSFMLDLYDILVPKEKDLSNLGIVDDYITEAHTNVEHAFENSITDNARAIFKEVKNEPKK